MQMADKLRDIEVRMDRLENRTKATFLEIEKRFEGLKTEQPALLGVHDMIHEMEDLLLLLQLEITKLKEKSSLEFGATPAPQQDVLERLGKLEEAVSSGTLSSGAGLPQLERRLAALEGRSYDRKTEPVASLDEVERKLDRLERRISSSIVDDVKKILQAGHSDEENG